MAESKSPLRVGVVGVGAFGRNHARVYRDLQSEGQPIKFAGVVDADFSRAQAVAAEFGTRAFRSVSDLIDAGVNAASVAVPTSGHLSTARQLMQAGIDVLIEKPLAASLQEANELVALAEQTGCIAQVGHLERFNPAVTAALPLITTPMFFEVHRMSVFTPRSLDVDVVLDLMIHDIDIVLAFTKSEVKEVRAVGLPVLSSKVDIANVRLELDSGCVANLTASRVSTERIRKLRFFQPRQYVSLDYSRQDVLVLTVDDTLPKELNPFDPASIAGSAFPAITPHKPPVHPQEPLRAELLSFLSALQNRTPPAVTLADGRRALQVALRIVDAMADHSRRANLQELTHTVS